MSVRETIRVGALVLFKRIGGLDWNELKNAPRTEGIVRSIDGDIATVLWYSGVSRISQVPVARLIPLSACQTCRFWGYQQHGTRYDWGDCCRYPEYKSRLHARHWCGEWEPIGDGE